MLSVSKPLLASFVRTYHAREFASEQQNYWSNLNKSVLDTSVDKWDPIPATNAPGNFLHSREALRAMLKQRSGWVVNVTSIASIVGLPGLAAYAASKGAIAQLTKVLAV